MKPLQRVATRSSLASWWSDSNPLLHAAPTINIHALATPLMKWMYHRQAVAFIAKDAPGQTLSTEMIEIYASYLACKYVSPETQLRVLEHLDASANSDRDTALEICSCSSAMGSITQMLLDEARQRRAFSLVKALLAHKLGLPSAEIIKNIDIRSGHFDNIIESVLVAISEHAEATAIVLALLGSKSAGVGQWACALVGELAVHLSFEDNLLRDLPIEMLFKHARDSNFFISSRATVALIRFAQHKRGAAATRIVGLESHIPDTKSHSISSTVSRGAFSLLSTLLVEGFSVDWILQGDSIGTQTRKMFYLLRQRDEDTRIRVLIALVQHSPCAAAIVAGRTPV
ncbi:hypothetical protein FB45DRAFT_901212 [Roridomyces roridus]|uniref:Uncharacterized protein n=1 Tax=Roridomyces roridus TaxID=1738132 RepID=A0AAD7FWN4_9AGAR|nr:hypothetical protein FB45DRAFT_901212 [Roridomyces roridus]